MDAAMIQIASIALGKAVQKGSISFDWSPNPFSDDDFTLEITYTNPGPPPTSTTAKFTGTYKKSGDTVTFKIGAENGIIQSGIVYTIGCSGKKLILKRPGAVDLTFDCG